MIKNLLAQTSLPNLHPAVVHFPVALLPAALVFDVASLLAARHRGWLARGAAALYVGAALAAAAAWWAGRRAADSLLDVPAQVQVHVNHHSDWGLYSLWAVVAAAVLRLVVGWWDADGQRRGLRVLTVVAGAAALVVVFHTADLGGGLVYQHAVAVAVREEAPAPAAGTTTADATAAEKQPAADPGPPEQRLVRGEDGTLTWTPDPRDRAALGTVLQPAPGSSLEAVAWSAPGPESQRGLKLAVDGEALLVLSGTFTDVQVGAELELGGFDGTVGLAHHVRGERQAGLLTVAVPDGTFALRTRRGDGAETLGEERRELPSGPLRLAVSAAGRHLKGMLDGATVVHGHEPALPEGSCGILLEGHGELGIVSVRVTPLTE